MAVQKPQDPIQARHAPLARRAQEADAVHRAPPTSGEGPISPPYQVADGFYRGRKVIEQNKADQPPTAGRLRTTPHAWLTPSPWMLMGGDHGPSDHSPPRSRRRHEQPDLRLILVGPRDLIEAELARHRGRRGRAPVHPAPPPRTRVGMDEPPGTRAAHQKRFVHACRHQSRQDRKLRRRA